MSDGSQIPQSRALVCIVLLCPEWSWQVDGVARPPQVSEVETRAQLKTQNHRAVW